MLQPVNLASSDSQATTTTTTTEFKFTEGVIHTRTVLHNAKQVFNQKDVVADAYHNFMPSYNACAAHRHRHSTVPSPSHAFGCIVLTTGLRTSQTLRRGSSTQGSNTLTHSPTQLLAHTPASAAVQYRTRTFLFGNLVKFGKTKQSPVCPALPSSLNQPDHTSPRPPLSVHCRPGLPGCS